MKPTFLKIIILGALLSLACTTKVSEWVLLNTLPTDYSLIYFHKDQLSENELKQNSEIDKKYTEQISNSGVSRKMISPNLIMDYIIMTDFFQNMMTRPAWQILSPHL